MEVRLIYSYIICQWLFDEPIVPLIIWSVDVGALNAGVTLISMNAEYFTQRE